MRISVDTAQVLIVKIPSNQVRIVYTFVCITCQFSDFFKLWALPSIVYATTNHLISNFHWAVKGEGRRVYWLWTLPFRSDTDHRSSLHCHPCLAHVMLAVLSAWNLRFPLNYTVVMLFRTFAMYHRCRRIVIRCWLCFAVEVLSISTFFTSSFQKIQSTWFRPLNLSF